MNWLIGACEAFDKHLLGFLNAFFTTLLKIGLFLSPELLSDSADHVFYSATLLIFKPDKDNRGCRHRIRSFKTAKRENTMTWANAPSGRRSCSRYSVQRGHSC
jgi:hypothetical protein